MVKRGDVWLVALDPTLGSEIRKTRPCVVMSPPELNQHLKTVIMAPMTSQGFEAPFRIALKFQDKQGLILLDQIRSVDKARLVKRLGSVPAATLQQVLNTMQELFSA